MKVACCALALGLAAGCGAEPTAPSGPLDHLRLPTGIAVDDQHRLLVASSNADLLFDEVTGGTVLSLDAAALPSVGIAGALDVRSFAGDMAIARTDLRFGAAPDAEACGTVIAADAPDRAGLALFATRGSNTLNALSIATDGTLSCAACGIPAGGGFSDPFSVAVACGGERPRAYFGYLIAPNALTVIGELDLVTFSLRTAIVGYGQARGLAYDRDRERLFLAGLATASPTPLRWIDLAGCTLGADVGAGGCTVGTATLPGLPPGLELRSIALANPGTPHNVTSEGNPRPPWEPIRAYVTARVYDASFAATVGFRTTDFGGLLIVLDLFDDGLGGVQPQVVWTVPIGHGAQDVRVLPKRAGRYDVVAALAVDEGDLTIYDDETHSVTVFRQDQLTGGPLLGHQPFGLAVDPVATGGIARVWVSSWGDSFVTPIDVPLDAPEQSGFATGTQLKITGATP